MSFPQGFEVRVDQPDFPFPRVGPLFLPQELGQFYGLWTKWITGTSGTGLGHFRFVLVEGILCGQGLLWKVRFQHVYQGEIVGFVLFHSSFQLWTSFEIGQEFSALFCGVVAVLGLGLLVPLVLWSAGGREKSRVVRIPCSSFTQALVGGVPVLVNWLMRLWFLLNGIDLGLPH